MENETQKSIRRLKEIAKDKSFSVLDQKKARYLAAKADLKSEAAKEAGFPKEAK